MNDLSEEDMYGTAARLIKEMDQSTGRSYHDWLFELGGDGDIGECLAEALVNMIRAGKITVNL